MGRPDQLRKDLSVLFLCAGVGTRLRSAGPKCLTNLHGETLLARLVRQFRARFLSPPIFVCVGFEEKKVRSKIKGVEFVRCPDHATTNVAESLRLGLEAAPPGPVLVCYGDLVLGEETVRSLQLSSQSVLWGESGLSRSGEVGLTVNERGGVGHLCHDLPIRWAQLALLQPEARAAFGRAFREAKSVGNWLGYEVLNHVIGRGSPFSFRPIDEGFVLEVDVPRDIEAARLAVELEREGVRCES